MNWHKTVQWDGTVLLGFDKPDSTHNTLNLDVLAELQAHLDNLNAPQLIIYSKKAAFCVGADINDFTGTDVLPGIEAGHACFRVLAALEIPTVTIINGHCLGGGAELALACKHRIATPDLKFGLPEVKLGLHPGWGGTVRLPDLVGAHNALPMLLNGKPVGAPEALRMGLVDSVCEQSAAIGLSRQLLARCEKKSWLSTGLNYFSNSWLARQVFAQVLYYQTTQKVQPQHYPSPFRIIDLWREYGAEQERLGNEAASFLALTKTPTAAALVKIYLLQESLKRGDKNHNIFRVHIVGSTQLAVDVAGLCAREGFIVSSDELLDATKFLSRKLQGSDLEIALGRIACDPTGLERADLVLEAVPEALAQKVQAVGRMQGAKSSAIIATTTGIYTLDKLQRLAQTSRLCGIHFFSPLGLVPLVEVRDEARLVSFAKSLGKLPVVVQDKPLLIVNRLLAPYVFEACCMLEEGYSAKSINSACRKFGMPVGPLEVLQKAGIEEWQAIAQECELRTPSLIQGTPLESFNGTKQASSDRLIQPLVKAALSAASNRLAAGPDLIDAAAIFGMGFAPFRGGPIQYSRDQPEQA